MKNHQSSEQKDAEGQKKTCNPHTHTEGGIEIEFGQDLKKQHKAEYDQTTAHSKWQLGATFITAGLVFIYTGIMLWQVFLTRQSLVSVQRAFVSADLMYPRIKESYPSGDRYFFNVEAIWNNSGTTPAIKTVNWFQSSKYLSFFSHLVCTTQLYR